MASIPDKYLDLFRKPAFANLATVMPDGRPQVTPVWVDYDGSNILVNTAEGRQKDRNLRRNPEVALGQRLAHQHRGDRRALLERASELLRHAHHRQSELVGLGQQLLGCAAAGVGLLSDGTHLLQREVAHGLAQHLLLVGGGEVK